MNAIASYYLSLRAMVELHAMTGGARNKKYSDLLQMFISFSVD